MNETCRDCGQPICWTIDHWHHLTPLAVLRCPGRQMVEPADTTPGRLMGRHAGEPATLDAIVSDYVTTRARDLIAQADTPGALNVVTRPLDAAEWIGSAVEILRELTRDA